MFTFGFSAKYDKDKVDFLLGQSNIISHHSDIIKICLNISTLNFLKSDFETLFVRKKDRFII